jgi:hypothetical protein
MILRRAKLFCVVLLLFSGCSGVRAPWVIPSGVERLSIEQSNSICIKLAAQRAEIRTIRALFNTEIIRKEERALSRSAFAIRDWEDLRVDSLPIQGSYTLGVATFLQGRGMAMNPLEKRAVAGRSPARIFSTLWPGFELSIAELTSLVSARVAESICRNSELTSTAAGVVLVERESGSTWQLDSEFALRRAILQNSDSPIFPLYVEWIGDVVDPLTRFRIASKISISAPNVSSQIALDYLKGSINQAIADRVFILQVPEDYVVSEVQ